MNKLLLNLKKKIRVFFLFQTNFLVSDIIKKLKRKIVLADIGAAGDIDIIWVQLESIFCFLLFDPDARSSRQFEAKDNKIIFPFGLGKENITKSLYLTAFPSASSLYKLNEAKLAEFINFKCHEVVGVADINLTTLDDLVFKDQALHPDFIKVDAEGSDLDILLGSQKVLNKSVKGLQVEVSFIERHQEAPFFSDIDKFLRSHGFELYHLAKEHWLKRDPFIAINSRPQLIWADATYMLEKHTFIQRLKLMDSGEERFNEILIYVILLLFHGFYDSTIGFIKLLFQNNDLIDNEGKLFITTYVEKVLKEAKKVDLKFIIVFLALHFAILIFSPILFLNKGLSKNLIDKVAGMYFLLSRKISLKNSDLGVMRELF